jgi:hypothetical protein
MMAKGPKSPAAGSASGRAARTAGDATLISPASVSVPIPHNTAITVKNLRDLDEEELREFLEKAKTSKVGFVILNAPFKVQADKVAAQAKQDHDSLGGE